MKTLTIKENDVNQRLDKFLRKALPKLSLPSIFKYIRNKTIKVNGKHSEIGYKVQLNDKIDIYLNDDISSKEQKNNDFMLAKDEFDVVYEDKNIIVVNKPVGVVVQDDISKTPDTLCNRLLKYLYRKKEWDPTKETNFVPSFVHRLDRNTAGLIIAAKNIESSRVLSEKIKNREIEKYYLCHIYGILTPKEGVLHAYSTESIASNIVKITNKPISDNSKEIITEYKTISHDKEKSLIEVHLITGRKHQIRAHFNFIGHPLVGEKKYTKQDVNHAKKTYQDLISKKIVFNFKSNNNILAYLNQKIIKI